MTRIIFKTKKEEKKYFICKSYYDEWENICYEWITSGGREMTESEIRRCKRTRLFRQLGVDNFDY